MSRDEISYQTSVNKLKTLRHPNRVSFGDTPNGRETPEYEYERPSTSSPPATPCLPALRRSTPVLFSTNRGLHLRVTSAAMACHSTASHNAKEANGASDRSQASASERCGIAALCRSKTSTIKSSTPPAQSSSYNVAFCDLERWSTNRAHSVCLEDTFTIARPAVVPQSAASGSLASNSLRFLTQSKAHSVRFKGYARFDIE